MNNLMYKIFIVGAVASVVACLGVALMIEVPTDEPVKVDPNPAGGFIPIEIVPETQIERDLERLVHDPSRSKPVRYIARPIHRPGLDAYTPGHTMMEEH